MPTITRETHRPPTIMIAERAADLLRINAARTLVIGTHHHR